MEGGDGGGLQLSVWLSLMVERYLLGSNVRVQERGSSCRKYSSGVMKGMPIFAARSLDGQ